jgi:SAM-dependent methyltransferase
MTKTSLNVGLAVALMLLGMGAAPTVSAQEAPSTSRDSVEKGAPYVPTPHHVVTRMLELAEVTASDVVYDLGSGDGRILIAAAKEYGARGVGVEIDSQLVQRARRRAREAGVADRVTFRQGNLFDVDLQDATVVTLYLWPDMNNRLRPKLRRELDPGDRIVSHSFDIDQWPADSTVTLDAANPTAPSKPLFRWTIPAAGATP